MKNSFLCIFWSKCHNPPIRDIILLLIVVCQVIDYFFSSLSFIVFLPNSCICTFFLLESDSVICCPNKAVFFVLERRWIDEKDKSFKFTYSYSINGSTSSLCSNCIWFCK